MAICHPFVVQRSRPAAKSTYHTVIHKSGAASTSARDNVESSAAKSPRCSKDHSDSKGSTNWIKKVKRSFKSPMRRNTSSGMTMKKRTSYYILPALILSVLFNIPKFFEFDTVVIPE